MTTRPTIFISSVSRELRSARQLVANTLQFLGYEPIWQDIFGTEQGDLCAMLRRKIDESQGVVQLLGRRYGAEPPTPDPQFGRVSYTQYEALYAQQQGKKVWYLVLAEDFPTDPAEPESEELRKLQQAYRDRLEGRFLYQILHTSDGMESSVLKLRNDLARLRRGFRQWAVGVSVMLVLILGISGWLVMRENRVVSDVQKNTEAATRSATAENRAYLDQVLHEMAQEKLQPDLKLTSQQRFDQAVEDVARERNIPVEQLKDEINVFVATVQHDPQADPLDQARAALVLQKNDEAAMDAQGAAEAARHEYEIKSNVQAQLKVEAEKARLRAIDAYQLEGVARENALRYSDALAAYESAASLTDQDREPILWSAANLRIACIFFSMGKYPEAEKMFRQIVELRIRVMGRDDRDTLTAEANLAVVLDNQGKYAEAEKDERAILAAQTRLLGGMNPETLRVRSNLGCVLEEEHKYVEAEKEDSDVLALRTLVLGPENRDTLSTRSNLASVLDDEHHYRQAEQENRAVLALRRRVLGPEHPETLASWSNLAVVLYHEGKYVEAEKEDRAILPIRQRILGPDHPDTFASWTNLGLTLYAQGKYDEAINIDRSTLETETRVLGADHPQMLQLRRNLTSALYLDHKYAETEDESRIVLRVYDVTLGMDDPRTITTRTVLILSLLREHKYSDVEEEARANLAAQKRAFGSTASDTLATETILAHVQALLDEWSQATATQQDLLAVHLKQSGVDEKTLIEDYTLLSRDQLLARDFAGSLLSAEAGLALDERSLVLESRRAHALLFLGRIDEAKKIYLKHIGETVEGPNKLWEYAILDDFDEFQKQGLTTSAMVDIRQSLRTTMKPTL